MKSIKGLLLKDFLNLNHYKVTFLIIILFMCVMSVTDKDFSNLLPIILPTMIGMIALSTFSYDEIAKSDKFLLTLPTNKKEIIQAKYILTIGLTLMGSIFSIAILILISQMIGKEAFNLETMIPSLLGGIFGVGLIESIQIPSIYKWGAEKGRIQMFVLVIIVMGAVGTIIYFLGKGTGVSINFDGMIDTVKKYGNFIMIGMTILMYYISYRISYRIYDKKEIN